MRSRGWVWVLGGVGLLACSHAKTTAAPPGGTGVGGSGNEQVHARPPPREGAPIAETPAGLRKPGGKKEIVQALSQRGYLPPHRSWKTVSENRMSEAIRAFQHDQGLAVTGFADQKTLRQLNLNPTEVDKSQAPRQGRHDHPSESR